MTARWIWKCIFHYSFHLCAVSGRIFSCLQRQIYRLHLPAGKLHTGQGKVFKRPSEARCLIDRAMQGRKQLGFGGALSPPMGSRGSALGNFEISIPLDAWKLHFQIRWSYLINTWQQAIGTMAQLRWDYLGVPILDIKQVSLNQNKTSRKWHTNA